MVCLCSSSHKIAGNTEKTDAVLEMKETSVVHFSSRCELHELGGFLLVGEM